MIGQTLGSYQIISQLGAGATGEVYLAQHRHLKRQAALKLLARTLVGRPELVERFLLEARATSEIEHPGIVKIFDCEVDPTGRPYIVMEYLAGQTLAERLAQSRPLPALTVARLCRGIAEALDAAHAKGIVHRDLKPENIFVEPDPPDSVKLVDFGIAKLAGELRAAQVHQTQAGAVMGTPLYMSPEQCRDSASIDLRTDLYSLGCVMFEMLTGAPPFAREALSDLVVAHLTEEAKDVRVSNPSVPAALAELCAALLQKRPADRPPNMRAVAARLGELIAGATTAPAAPRAAAAPAASPVAAARAKTTFSAAATEIAPPGDVSASAKRRGPVLVAAAAIAVALVAGGLVVARRHAPGASNPTVAGAAAGAVAGAPPAAAAGAVAGEPSTAGASAAVHGEPSAGRAQGHAVARSTFKSWAEFAKFAPSSEAGEAPPPPKQTPANSVLAVQEAKSAPAAPARPETSPARPDTAPARLDAAPARPDTAQPAPGKRAARGSAGLVGAWEGPWTDPDKGQKGRLSLQIAADGAVAGWMFTSAAQKSYRMAGRMAAGGALDLACQCPPGQGFAARGTVRSGSDSELKGLLSLSTTAGVFGQSHLALRRAAAK